MFIYLQKKKKAKKEKKKKLLKILSGDYQNIPFFHMIQLLIVVLSGIFHCKILYIFEILWIERAFISNS